MLMLVEQWKGKLVFKEESHQHPTGCFPLCSPGETESSLFEQLTQHECKSQAKELTVVAATSTVGVREVSCCCRTERKPGHSSCYLHQELGAFRAYFLLCPSSTQEE